MNAFHSCDGTAIFIWLKMKCSIQLGFASLNRTFHLSPHENICTIALITIHYLYIKIYFRRNKKQKRLLLTCSTLPPPVNKYMNCVATL